MKKRSLPKRMLAALTAGVVVFTAFSSAALSQADELSWGSEYAEAGWSFEDSGDEVFDAGDDSVDEYIGESWDEVAADENAASDEANQEQNENPDDIFASDDTVVTEAPAQVVTEAPAQVVTEAPAIITTEAPAQVVTQAPQITEAPVETTTEQVTETTETETETTTADTSLPDTKLPVQVVQTNPDGTSVLLRTYSSLNEGVDREVELQRNGGETGAINIILSQNISVDNTVNIPDDANVIIGGNGDIRLSRGSSFGGVLFAVSGTLQLGAAKANNVAGTLTVDGGSSASGVSGSLINVLESGVLGLQRGVILQNNYTSAPGSAIYISPNAAEVLFAGGTIRGNMTSSEIGGAVYIESGFDETIFGITSEECSIVIKDNTAGSRPGNVVLRSGDSSLYLGGSLAGSEIHMLYLPDEDTDLEGSAAVAVYDEKSGLEDDPEAFARIATTQFVYDDPAFVIDEEGSLLVNESPVPTTPVEPDLTPTDTPTPTPHVEPVFTPTDTPTPSPTFVPFYPTVTDTPTPTPTLAPPTPTSTNTPTPTVPARAPYVPSISECTATGAIFEAPQVFAPGFMYDFEVHGASAEDYYTERVEGDGRWVFLNWSQYADGRDAQPNKKIGSTAALLEPNTYTIYIFFRLYTWSMGNQAWMETSTVASISKQFSNVAITATPSSRTTTTPGAGSGSSSGSGYSGSSGYSSSSGSSGSSSSSSAADYVALTRAAQTGTPGSASGTTTGTVTTTAGASTADNSPLEGFTLTGLLSLIALFALVIRKRQMQ